jgi:hypothetical protein
MVQGSSVSNEQTAATETSEDAEVSGLTQQLPSSLFDFTTHSDRTADQLVGEGHDRATVPSSLSRVISFNPSIRLRTFSDPEFMHLYLCHK